MTIEISNLQNESNKQPPVSSNEQPDKIVSVKLSVLNILIKDGFILEEKYLSIKTIKNLEEYVENLSKQKLENMEIYWELFFKTGIINLGKYLLLINFISEGILNIALEIQKTVEDKRLGEILRDMLKKQIGKSEKNKEKIQKLISILEKLKIIRIGEYALADELITEEELEECVQIGIKTNTPLGEVLLEQNKVNTEQLNSIFLKMGIEINNEKNKGEWKDIGNDIYELRGKDEEMPKRNGLGGGLPLIN